MTRDERLPSPSVRSVLALGEVEGLAIADVSEVFAPFVRHFMRDTLRAGGEVVIAERDGRVTGVFLYSPREEVATVFARSRDLSELLVRGRSGLSLYSELDLGRPFEPYHVYAVDLPDWTDERPFRHPVRAMLAGDLERVGRTISEVYGRSDERWLATMPEGRDRGFVVELEGAIVGVAFASLVGPHGRLHSVSVLARYRRLGIGSDLLRARLLWLKAAGARRAVSEIADRNQASRRLAEGAGMRAVAPLYLYALDGPSTATTAR